MWPLNHLGSLAKDLHVRSAVNPSLWACAVISLPLFYFSSTTAGAKSVAFFIIGLLPILSFSVSYLWFVFKNPEFLRSESYQTRTKILEVLGDHDNPFNANADHMISLANNPELPPPTPQTHSLQQLSIPSITKKNE